MAFFKDRVSGQWSSAQGSEIPVSVHKEEVIQSNTCSPSICLASTVGRTGFMAHLDALVLPIAAVSTAARVRSVRIESAVSLLSSNLPTTPHFHVTCKGFTTDHKVSPSFCWHPSLALSGKLKHSKPTPSLVHLCLHFLPPYNNSSGTPYSILPL